MSLIRGSISVVVLQLQLQVALLLLLTHISASSSSTVSEHVLVTTPFGQLKGFRAAARSGRTYNTFRAIPYAKPPIGERRFQPPEEYGNWNGIHDGSVDIPVCLQADLISKEFVGQEDCLVLNVYSPLPLVGNPTSEGNLLFPVMVYFHGGHWMSGSSGVYGPQYFMDEDVVLVTVNYRLGGLGFLNTGDGVVSGNMGLKDQVLALKWVQAAVKGFGGDKDLVTIFGESAGGASVDYHTLSPLSTGLFHRAISQSGTTLCPWAFSSNTKAAAQTLAAKLNCSTDSPTEEMVSCLRSVDGLKLVEVHQEIFSPLHAHVAIFGPSVENVEDKSGEFLTELPSKMLGEGRRQTSRVPHLLGVTAEDGCYRSAAIIDNEWARQLQANWTTLAPNLFIYNEVENKGQESVAAKILKHYFGVEKLTSATPPLFNRKNYAKFTAAISDRYFFKCTRDSALAHAAAAAASSSSAPVFLYWLENRSSAFGFGNMYAAAYGGSGNKCSTFIENVMAAYSKKVASEAIGEETFNYGNCHADELLYLFDLHLVFTISPSSPNYGLSRAMVKTWVIFAKTGSPGPFMGIEWEKVNPKEPVLSFMKLESFLPAMIKEPFASGARFWDSLNIS